MRTKKEALTLLLTAKRNIQRKWNQPDTCVHREGFGHETQEIILQLNNSLVRPDLKHAVQVWFLFYKKNTELQRRATKRISVLKFKLYEERLKSISLSSREYYMETWYRSSKSLMISTMSTTRIWTLNLQPVQGWEIMTCTFKRVKGKMLKHRNRSLETEFPKNAVNAVSIK